MDKAIEDLWNRLPSVVQRLIHRLFAIEDSPLFQQAPENIHLEYLKLNNPTNIEREYALRRVHPNFIARVYFAHNPPYKPTDQTLACIRAAPAIIERLIAPAPMVCPDSRFLALLRASPGSIPILVARLKPLNDLERSLALTRCDHSSLLVLAAQLAPLSAQVGLVLLHTCDPAYARAILPHISNTGPTHYLTYMVRTGDYRPEFNVSSDDCYTHLSYIHADSLLAILRHIDPQRLAAHEFGSILERLPPQDIAAALTFRRQTHEISERAYEIARYRMRPFTIESFPNPSDDVLRDALALCQPEQVIPIYQRITAPTHDDQLIAILRTTDPTTLVVTIAAHETPSNLIYVLAHRRCAPDQHHLLLTRVPTHTFAAQVLSLHLATPETVDSVFAAVARTNVSLQTTALLRCTPNKILDICRQISEPCPAVIELALLRCIVSDLDAIVALFAPLPPNLNELYMIRTGQATAPERLSQLLAHTDDQWVANVRALAPLSSGERYIALIRCSPEQLRQIAEVCNPMSEDDVYICLNRWAPEDIARLISADTLGTLGEGERALIIHRGARFGFIQPSTVSECEILLTMCPRELVPTYFSCLIQASANHWRLALARGGPDQDWRLPATPGRVPPPEVQYEYFMQTSPRQLSSLATHEWANVTGEDFAVLIMRADFTRIPALFPIGEWEQDSIGTYLNRATAIPELLSDVTEWSDNALQIMMIRCRSTEVKDLFRRIGVQTTAIVHTAIHKCATEHVPEIYSMISSTVHQEEIRPVALRRCGPAQMGAFLTVINQPTPAELIYALQVAPESIVARISNLVTNQTPTTLRLTILRSAAETFTELRCPISETMLLRCAPRELAPLYARTGVRTDAARQALMARVDGESIAAISTALAPLTVADRRFFHRAQQRSETLALQSTLASRAVAVRIVLLEAAEAKIAAELVTANNCMQTIATSAVTLATLGAARTAATTPFQVANLTRQMRREAELPCLAALKCIGAYCTAVAANIERLAAIVDDAQALDVITARQRARRIWARGRDDALDSPPIEVIQEHIRIGAAEGNQLADLAQQWQGRVDNIPDDDIPAAIAQRTNEVTVAVRTLHTIRQRVDEAMQFDWSTQ